MPFPLIPLAIAGISGLAGALKGKSQQTQTSMPTLDPRYAGIQQSLINMITNRMKSGSSLPAGYETGQIGNINQTYNRIAQSQGNNLTARGLSTSPVAGVVDTNRDLSRAGDITKMQASLPILERQLQTEDMALANSLLGQARGTTSTGTSTAGGGAAGGVGNLASMLAFMYGLNSGNGQAPIPSSNPYAGLLLPGFGG